MIHTWLAEVSALHEETVYRKYYEQVPAFRQEKADRLRHQEDKALSVGAWVLLQEMEKAYHLQGDYVFNLSHSGNCAICSIDISGDKEAELGCDIERIGKERLGMAERYFCPDEQKVDFYRMWVLKESFMKATRMGSNLALNAFEIAFSEEDFPYMKRQPEAFPKKYYLKEYWMKEAEYRIAVCADHDTFAEEIKKIKL